MSLSFKVMNVTSLPAASAPSTKDFASSSELLFGRMLVEITVTFFAIRRSFRLPVFCLPSVCYRVSYETVYPREKKMYISYFAGFRSTTKALHKVNSKESKMATW